jgi:hypothetical protein
MDSCINQLPSLPAHCKNIPLHTSYPLTQGKGALGLTATEIPGLAGNAGVALCICLTNEGWRNVHEKLGFRVLAIIRDCQGLTYDILPNPQCLIG